MEPSTANQGPGSQKGGAVDYSMREKLEALGIFNKEASEASNETATKQSKGSLKKDKRFNKAKEFYGNIVTETIKNMNKEIINRRNHAGNDQKADGPSLKESINTARESTKIGVSLNKDALDLLKSIDEGGVPAMMTARLRKIAEENGFDVKRSDTPNSIIERLRKINNKDSEIPPTQTTNIMSEKLPSIESTTKIEQHVEAGMTPEKLKEERQSKIIAEIEAEWVAAHGPMMVPLSKQEIEKNKARAQKLGQKGEVDTTRMSEEASEFFFDHKGKGRFSVPKRAEKILKERFPEYTTTPEPPKKDTEGVPAGKPNDAEEDVLDILGVGGNNTSTPEASSIRSVTKTPDEETERPANEAEKSAILGKSPVVSTTTAETVAATLPSPEAPATAPDEVAPEVEIAKALETLSPKEKKEVALGLENIGYYIEEKKNRLFASAFDSAREIGVKREWLKENGTLDRWVLGFSQIMTKNAEMNHKKMEHAEKDSMGRIMSLGSVAGNALKYGRIVTDVLGTTIGSPLRYVMMGGMLFGQGFAAGKEARMQNDEVLSKVRKTQDMEEAWDEANLFLARAKVYSGKETGGEITSEDLEKTYLDEAPKDLLNRLQKEPGTASGILEKIVKWDINKSMESINSELERNENDSALSEVDKKIEREKILQGYAQHIKDLDRAVGQFGTVDALALGAKYAETASKTVVAGMMVETIALSLEKLWEKIPSLIHHAPEVAQAAVASTQASNHASGLITPATPDSTATGLTTPATPGSAMPLLGTNEEILKLATIKAGDGVTRSFIRQLMQNPAAFGFKSVTGEANEIEEWAFDRAVCLAEKGGYITDAGETRINTAGIGNVAYVLGIDPNGTIQISEEIKGGDGKFQINPEGVKSLNKYEYASTPEVNAPQGEEAPANAGPTVTDKAPRITMNDAWWIQYTAEHPNEDYTEMRKIIGERAAEIALYQDKLDSLSQKGQGDSYYADFLREKLEKTIIETENTYGDVFNDVSAHTNPAEIPHSPESSASANTAHEVSVSSSEFPSYASDRVHDEINKLFGSKGFLGFGAQDGINNANWIAFSGIPAEDVINAKHSVIEGSFFEGGRGYGMNNNESIDKMQGLISEEIKRTGGKITPTKNETVEHFLNRMAEVKSSVEERVVPKVEIQHAPEKVAVTSRVLPPPPPAPPVPGVLPPPPRL